MNDARREELLARFAQGSLVPAEREELFAAALDDQALFDAIAEEDAVRGVLEDSSARAAVLAELQRPRRPNVLRFRPRTTLMASMLAAAAAIVLWMRVPGTRDLLEAARPSDGETVSLWAAAGSSPISRSPDSLAARLEIAPGSGDAGFYHVGEKLSITASVSADAWATVLLLAPEQVPRQLFPRGDARAARAAAGTPLSLGSLRAPAVTGRYRIRLVAVRAQGGTVPEAGVFLEQLDDGIAAFAEAVLVVTAQK